MKRNEGMGIDTDYVCPRLVVIDLKYVRMREFSDCRPFPLVNVTHENLLCEKGLFDPQSEAPSPTDT